MNNNNEKYFEFEKSGWMVVIKSDFETAPGNVSWLNPVKISSMGLKFITDKKIKINTSISMSFINLKTRENRDASGKVSRVEEIEELSGNDTIVRYGTGIIFDKKIFEEHELCADQAK